MSKHILVVDDDNEIREALENGLSRRTYTVTTAASVAEGRSLLKANAYPLAILDYTLGDGNGFELLEQIKSDNPDTRVLMITAHNDFSLAVEAIKRGAFDFVPKPFTFKDILPKIEKALEHVSTQHAVEVWKRQSEQVTMIGSSPAFTEALRMLKKLAESPSTTALLLGESGVGKEVAAQYIHDHSSRKDQPFVALNCNALPADLFESELFGHVQGAFTGASTDKAGFFELADGGTLFLDEIGDLSLELQTKLLRAIQERTFYKVGGNKKMSADVRIIAATNKNLYADVQAGKFRNDLYFRLNVISITLPALRERSADIKDLAEFFLRKFNKQFNKKIQGLAPAAERLLLSYHFPGNIRELQNALERAVLLTEHVLLQPSDFGGLHWESPNNVNVIVNESPLKNDSSTSTITSTSTLGDGAAPFQAIKEQKIAEFEKQYLVQMLQSCQGRVTSAAEKSGMLVPALSRLLKKHGIAAGDFK